MYHCTVIASLGLMQVAPFWGFRHHRDSEYSLYVYGFEAVLYGTCGLDGCSAVIMKDEVGTEDTPHFDINTTDHATG